MKLSKISKLFRINWFKFVYYNFLCHKVIRRGRGLIIPYWHSVIDLHKDARIELYDGRFSINDNKPRHTHAEAFVILRDNGKLIIRGNTGLAYLSTIEIHKDAVIDIDSAFINSGAVILSGNKITIGKEVLISRNVYIYDSDHHKMINEEGEPINPSKPVVIGNHVWIGLKSIILKGTKIGDGAVITAGSVVGGKVKAGMLSQGNPARSYYPIKWEA